MKVNAAGAALPAAAGPGQRVWANAGPHAAPAAAAFALVAEGSMGVEVPGLHPRGRSCLPLQLF